MKEKVHVEGKFRFCPDYFSASASFANMVCPSLIQANIFCYIATSTVFFAFGLLLSSWVQKAPMMRVCAYERFSASTGASCQVFKKNLYRKGFFRYGGSTKHSCMERTSFRQGRSVSRTPLKSSRLVELEYAISAEE